MEENDLCVYGVLDGFQGAHVSDFVAKRIPAELLWGQLVPEKSGHFARSQPDTRQTKPDIKKAGSGATLKFDTYI